MGSPRRYMFDDVKLRNRALLELARNLRSDRMIALTGAMSSEALGYFPWDGLCQRIGEAASDAAAVARCALGDLARLGIYQSRRGEAFLTKIEELADVLKSEVKRPVDKRVQFSLIRESLAELDDLIIRSRRPTDAFDVKACADGENLNSDDNRSTTLSLRTFDTAVASAALKRTPGPERCDSITPLLASLGISRFATLNYDLELERALMLREDERKLLDEHQASVMAFVQRCRTDLQAEPTSPAKPILRDRLNRLSRVLGNGAHVESDVLDRERPDRLFEFAIASPDTAQHVMHLHGRADLPESLVVDIRHYDRLYRLDDLFRNPFEHGLRVLLAGNPILFVGLGMSEDEINRQLQYFVSNSPHRRMAPAFLVWNTLGPFENDAEAKATIEGRRIDFLQRLGVQVIFDVDVMAADEVAAMRNEHAPLNKAVKDAEAALVTAKKELSVASGDSAVPTAGPGDSAAAKSELRMATEKVAACSVILLEARKAQRTGELNALAKTLEALPPLVKRLSRRASRDARLWRSIDPRLEKPRSSKGQPQPVRLWGTVDLRLHAEKRPKIHKHVAVVPIAHPKPKPESRALVVGVAEPGFGRGALAEEIVQEDVHTDAWAEVHGWNLQHTKRDDRMLVNAGFSYDSDAMLNAIAQFLARRRFPNGKNYLLGAFSREKLFSDPNLYQGTPRLLVVINGIDRFFGFDGAPLSAELDHLIRCIVANRAAPPSVQWVLLGTDRVRRYFDSLGITATTLTPPHGKSHTGIGSCYLDAVVDAFQARFATVPKIDGDARTLITPAADAKIETALLIDREAVRRAFYAAYLAPQTLASVQVDGPLSFEVLRTLAFIGTPVEADVLRFAPKVDAMLRECAPEGVAHDDYFIEVVEQLRALRLLLEIAPFDQSPKTLYLRAPRVMLSTRFGLHRSLATELRERHGAPLSEAKLSTTFNMSLFAAQPSENFIPKSDFHDELNELVDRLIGSWKEEEGPKTLSAKDAKTFAAALAKRPIDDDPEGPVTLLRTRASLYGRRASANIRAALSVLRGYYSTASLLGLDSSDPMLRRSEDGPLSEHAERLDRLLRNFGRIAAARQAFREIAGEIKLTPQVIEAELGPEPFYPDDLVWLHNERGVVKLVQGHLYDARRSLSLAQRANEQHLEHGYRGHNWRRIGLNTVQLLIERGRFKRAERRIDEIETSIDTAPWEELLNATHARATPPGSPISPRAHSDEDTDDLRRVARIREIYGAQDRVIDDCASADYAREEILTVGLTTGYRGLIAHMRGRYRTAQEHYRRAISILRRLGEQRAYALFQRHYATLRRFTGGTNVALREIEYSVAAAASIRQMDISYRSRIVRATLTRRDPTADPLRRRVALEEIREALEYAARSDTYRVRVEASSALAREMRLSGDYDTALQYAADALAIACRYGHSLHKIALRVEIGQILIQRGDPKSGAALIESAVTSAMRTGNQRTVDVVQRSLGNDLLRPHFTDGILAQRQGVGGTP